MTAAWANVVVEIVAENLKIRWWFVTTEEVAVVARLVKIGPTANLVVDTVFAVVVETVNAVVDIAVHLVNLVWFAVDFVAVEMVTTAIDTATIVVVDRVMHRVVDMVIVVDFDTANLDLDSLMNCNRNPEIVVVCTGHSRNEFYFCY